ALGPSQLLGRGTTGDIAAISLGSGLTMTGTTLSATTSGGGGATGLTATQDTVTAGSVTLLGSGLPYHAAVLPATVAIGPAWTVIGGLGFSLNFAGRYMFSGKACLVISKDIAGGSWITIGIFRNGTLISGSKSIFYFEGVGAEQNTVPLTVPPTMCGIGDTISVRAYWSGAAPTFAGIGADTEKDSDLTAVRICLS
ncbi:MAG: hypothetical protein N2112_12915, partial [Gemmataceae bacterium]|nr:hypothetical protein [Gemmataceae bacterium]